MLYPQHFPMVVDYIPFHQYFIISWWSMCKGISDVMVSILASIVVDHEFDPRSGQSKDNKSGICCLSDSMQH